MKGAPRTGGERARARYLAAIVGLTLICATIARAEITQRGDLRVNFQGNVTPRALPRSGVAPVRVEVGAKITDTKGAEPPELRRIAIAINRHGHFTPAGLPICHLGEIQPASTADALRSCRSSLVGEGTFSAKVLLPEQAPFPSQGKVFVFNAVFHGGPAMLAHVYGTHPVSTSYTLPFAIRRAKGTYGTVLVASLPPVTADWGHVTGLSTTLGRLFTSDGHRHSYFSAGCPAPPSLPAAIFPFARGSFSFAGHITLTSTVTRSCKAQG